MWIKRLTNLLLIAIILISLGFSESCKGKKKAKEGEAKPQASQQITTPTLKPPATDTKTVPQVKQAPSSAAQRPGPQAEGKPIELPGPPAALEAAPEPPKPPTLPPLKTSQPETPSLSTTAAPSITPSAIPPEAVPFVPTLVKADANINVILDASGSQSALFGGTGTSKLDLQKRALQDVIYSLIKSEFERNIGIRVFGSQVPLDQHNCQDTKEIYPVSKPDLDQIQNVLASLKAQGESPVAYALEAAAKDFPAANVDQIIVLVTDGFDTCNGDPCDTAKRIRALNPKLSVQVIGFDISQEDAQKVRCIAENADGRFYLARNENELRKFLDEAVNSMVPYNLRLSTVAGATPIPTTITVFKSGTNQVVKKESSFGTKLISLPAGTYDIMVEYTLSPEMRKPSKIIKGVDILEKTKVEQEINFDFAALSLSSIDTEAKMTAADYKVQKSDTGETVAQIDGGPEMITIFLSPGTYDITAEQKYAVAEKIALKDRGVELKTGQAVDKIFRFQKGTLALKGITTQKTPIPFIYQIYKADRSDQLIASGALPADGGSIHLSPDGYDLIFIGQDPAMLANPRTKVSGVNVKAGETTNLEAVFEMGLLKLSAVDGAGNPMRAAFTVRIADTKEDIAQTNMVDAKTPITLPIPPGKYNIIASKLDSNTEPKPSVTISDVKVTKDKPVNKVAKFIFGTARLRGVNAKEQPLETAFAVYKAGTENLIAKAPPSTDWLAFELGPGIYDAEAVYMGSEKETKPSLWLKDINVQVGKQVSHEAIFTAGRLKIIGRGSNNKIIKCHFKIYQYGSDTELISGDTGDDWQVFEIMPGSYYLEAGYVDPVASVLLKKWINVKVGDNEVLELVLRF